ncbi:MAG: FecR domain-containing protein [Nitrosomonas sp.]|nr:FecR domain-containing protein [Nitrosomonas sp.]
MNQSSAPVLRQKKYLLPFLSAAMAMLAGAVIFILPPPLSTQLHETAAGQYQSVVVTPNVTIELDANSAITVTNSEPPRVELIQGSIYFSGDNKAINAKRLEVIMGDVRFWDMGADFSLETIKTGGSIAIENGQIEMVAGEQTRLISAGQRVDFDNQRVIESSSIIGLKIAPWRR